MAQLVKILFVLVMMLSLWSFEPSENGEKEPVLDLAKLNLIGSVDERFQSINVEMCEVVGGQFWVPYHLIDTARVKKEGLAALKRKIDPINLYNPKLRKLTEALGPMYIRVSGTWANTTYFQNDDSPKLAKAPEGFENVMTRNEWKGVIDFVNDLDNQLVTSFAISKGIRDEKGNWTPAQIQPLLEYTRAINGKIAAAEMFNEPSHASYGGAPEGYDPAQYARDFVAFSTYVKREIPSMKIMGPGSTGEGGILGEVHEMGMLFLCFSPALYANVSDAWTLPNKWHRIIISAAGIYVELIIASIATFVWWNTPNDPFVNNLALCIMIVCSVSTVVFNANPLMRYDGYYALADWLEPAPLK